MARSELKASNRDIRVEARGLRIGDEVVPLWAASAHYWRLEPGDWKPVLRAVRDVGFRFVDTYVPWDVHELGPGDFDFGTENSKLDVVRFLELAHELGLYCIVRPGPHINAELTRFGIPERVIWDPECQARSPEGKPVVLPAPPLAFPVPSYASEAYLTEVAQWYGALGAVLGPLAHPDGPIVLLQVDNEGALFFRDGVYDQDYHPDAVASYRRFLGHKYHRVADLRQTYGMSKATIAGLEPPHAFDARGADDLARHLDWAEFQEVMLEESLTRMAALLADSGLGGVPTSHNIPLGEVATPLDPARVGRAVDLIGLDYYHGSEGAQRATIARRTSELANRSAARGHVAFACELGAGFPYFFRPLTPADSEFTVLTALAYGLRGFNAYMAVERDRWVGSPIDPRGRRRPWAEFWERLLAALERTRFHELERPTPVHIVVPRSLRRLSRTTHAFGPVSAAFFEVLGLGAAAASLEEDLGLGGPVPVEVDALLREIETELDAHGIAFAYSADDLLERALDRARWTIVASGGGLARDSVRVLRAALEAGAPVTLGPYPHLRDDSLRDVSADERVPTSSPRGSVPALLTGDADVAAAVRDAAGALDLPRIEVSPSEARVTVHETADGRPCVVFVINPSEQPLRVRARVPGLRDGAHPFDALTGERQIIRDDRLDVDVSAGSVRMIELR